MQMNAPEQGFGYPFNFPEKIVWSGLLNGFSLKEAVSQQDLNGNQRISTGPQRRDEKFMVVIWDHESNQASKRRRLSH
jgi:hypothetical protein